MFDSASHSWAELTRELSSWTVEEEFYIYVPMYYSLYSFRGHDTLMVK